jgi:hypothetical protein
VSVGRLRRGELIALVGAVGLLVVLFLKWFDLDAGALTAQAEPEVQRSGFDEITVSLPDIHQTGWATLGWFLDALLVLSIAGGLALSYMTLKRATPAWPVGASILTIAVGGIAFLVLLVRVVLAQPGLGVGLPDGAVAAELPAYLGLLFAALIPVGAWMALGDERKDAPESAYTPPPARPVPGT